MKTIAKKRASQICSYWHGGQWSKLYQFASSAIFVPANILEYLRELQECREPEFYLHPGTISKKDDRELKSVQSYFIREAQKSGIEIKWFPHPVYGYVIPGIAENLNNIEINKLKLFI